MEISSLKAFVSVAENGSFSIAARQLFLTQPAISKRIALLEAELRVALFDRSGRSVHLTEAGNTLLVSARQILKDIETASDQIHSLGSDIRGRLRIATSHHIGIHRLPPVLRTFTQRYPSVVLDLQFMDSELATQDVQRGEIEMAVVTLPLERVTTVETIPVWHDPLTVVAPHDHPLALATRVRAIDLGKHPAVLPAIGTITRDIVSQFLAGNGIDVKIALETNYLETIRVMVGVGLGWSALPANMISDDIKAIPVEGLDLQRTLGIVRQTQRTPSGAAARFVDELKAAAE